MFFRGRTRRFALPALAIVVGVCAVSTAVAARPPQQASSSDHVGEVVATLATGRVTILSGRDGFVVAAVGSAFEPDSFPPLIVPLSGGGVAVILGADDWIVPPPDNRTLLRLDEQLPHLVQGISGNTPSLNPGANISHLDQFGLGVLERLRAAASNLHDKIHLPQDLPLAEILLIRKTDQEPLSVREVSYWIRQTFWQENFWSTEVERPRYMQLYPIKGDKSGFLQVSYPPGDTTAGLHDWLSRPSGRFAHAIGTSQALAAAQRQFADGKLRKIRMAELVPLVKTALETMAGSTAAKALVAFDEKGGFTWVIQPPIAKKPAKRPGGAPTLEPKPHLE